MSPIPQSAAQIEDEEAPQPGVFGDCGLVLFDDPADHNAGAWAAINGGDPVRVSGVGDLPSDVLWISNVDWADYTASGHYLVHNLRRADYLRASIRQISADLGINMVGGSAVEAVQKLSTVTSRVYRLARQHYNLTDQDFANPMLSEDIRAKFGHPQRPAPNMAADLMGAYQTDSSLVGSRRYTDDIVYVTLRQNRLRYFTNLLVTPMPDDSWEHVPDTALPRDAKGRLDWAIKRDAPVLVEASLEADSASDLATLCAFGVRTGSRTSLRRWVSHIELLWLSKYYRVTIKSAWVSMGYRDLFKKHRIPEPLTEPFLRLSYSAGLLAESHFHALSAPIYVRGTGQKEVNPMAVWLRAADRAAMFILAKRLQEDGFQVTGYGMGGVRLKLSRYGGDPERLAEHAVMNGYVYPPPETILNA